MLNQTLMGLGLIKRPIMLLYNQNGVLMGRVTGLPVNGDLEDGFGLSPEDCAATVMARSGASACKASAAAGRG